LTLWGTTPWRTVAQADIGISADIDDIGLPPDLAPPLALSDDGRSIGYGTGKIRGVWSTRRGERLDRLRDRDMGGDFALSPTGALALSTYPPRLWEMRTGRLVARLGGRADEVGGAAFSPGDRYVATFGRDTVRVWTADAGKPVSTVLTGGVVSAAFGHDGRLLLTSGLDGVAVWDPETGKQVAKLVERSTKALLVAFADGDRAVLVSDGDAVQILRCDACRPFDELTGLAERRTRPRR
jgi:WD40 repeat protein